MIKTLSLLSPFGKVRTRPDNQKTLLGFWFLAFLALLGMSLAGTPSANAQTLSNKASALANVARIGGDVERTRFVVDLSRVVKYKVFVLKSPNRVVIDLPQVKFLFPDGQGNKDKGLIQAYRYGLVGKGKSRIVIDIKEPVTISKTFIKRSEYGQPARMVIEMQPVRKKVVQSAKVTTNSGKEQSGSNFFPSHRPDLKKGKTRVASLSTAPKISKRNDVKLNDGRTVIVIDAGHGGEDAGAKSRRGTKEKHIVLAFAQNLKKNLEKTGKYRVLMTRDSDVFIPLRDRVLFAIGARAGLFISIHADSVPGSWRRRRRARGATIYTLDEEGAAELDRLIAEEQNKTPVMKKISFPKGYAEVLKKAHQAEQIPDIVKALTELTQRETNNYSVAFANEFLIKKLKKVTRMSHTPIRSADFHVLRNAEIPSVLLEIGFLSNKSDERNLRSKNWRKKVSRAVAQAISQYVETSKMRRPF